MMFTNVSGTIGKYTSNIETNGDEFTAAIIEFTGETDSVTTGTVDRDTHLLSPDFFDAAQYPKIDFTATSVTKVDEGDFEITGNLTMHGETKPVILAVEYGGLMKDPWGNIKGAFSLSAKINRKDWGLSWNAALETGGVLVSDEVRIIAEVQLVKK